MCKHIYPLWSLNSQPTTYYIDSLPTELYGERTLLYIWVWVETATGMSVILKVVLHILVMEVYTFFLSIHNFIDIFIYFISIICIYRCRVTYIVSYCAVKQLINLQYHIHIEDTKWVSTSIHTIVLFHIYFRFSKTKRNNKRTCLLEPRLAYILFYTLNVFVVCLVRHKLQDKKTCL